MPYIVIRHRVRNFETWKAVYDDHASVRAAAGSIGARLFRDVDSPDEVVVLIEASDLDKFRTFIDSDDLRETMQRAGVIGPPDFHFLDEVDHSEA